MNTNRKLVFEDNLIEKNEENFKLQINSNDIRADSSTLPDELRNLGVCAFDELAFKQGFLFSLIFLYNLVTGLNC